MPRKPIGERGTFPKQFTYTLQPPGRASEEADLGSDQWRFHPSAETPHEWHRMACWSRGHRPCRFKLPGASVNETPAGRRSSDGAATADPKLGS